MNCKIYRSDTKPGLYLYLAIAKNISDLPTKLLTMLGTYSKVMELDLNTRNRLATEDINVVKANLQAMGYHLQIPNDLVKNVLNYQ